MTSMSKKTLKFNIRQDGTVTEEVIGVTGDVCENLTAEIEKKLGALQNRVHKAEYYQQQNTEKNVTLQHNKNHNQE
tara:strand:+ start:322 stop:549 length:228 start_codon:yes stop_codon:yes gene_type:complete